MRAFDPFLVLVGNRGAIERSATTAWALLVGAIFVVTAGIARNYDHLYFAAEWEWIVGPFVASLVSAAFIYMISRFSIYCSASEEEIREKDYRTRFLPFLALFWLTAPCAWIYALPVERWGDILFSTKWNLAFLGIVSVWRVLIIARVVHVLTNANWLLSFLVILVPAAFEVMVASFLKSMSLVAVMGGVRLPPHHQFLKGASSAVTEVSAWLFFGGLVLLVFAIARNRVSNREKMASFPAWERGSDCKRALQVALGFLVLWMAVSVMPQIPVRNSWKLTQLARSKDYAGAIDFATEKGEMAFSRLHYLPPRPYEGGDWQLLALLTALPEDSPKWLREEWADNFVLSLGTGYEWTFSFREMEKVDGKILPVFEIPEVKDALRRHRDALLGSFSNREYSKAHLEAFRKDLDSILDPEVP